MPLARGAGELKGCVHHIGLEAHAFCHVLHKEGVPTAEGRHGQNAYRQFPIKAPAETEAGSLQAPFTEAKLRLWAMHVLQHGDMPYCQLSGLLVRG